MTNTNMTKEQLRNRLQDRLEHLRERIEAAPDRLRPHMKNEIAATIRRLNYLNEKDEKRVGE